MTLGTMGHCRTRHSPSFLGTQHGPFPFSPRPRNTIMTVCPGPSLLPGPASCLGPQLTPSPCPHPPSPSPVPIHLVCLCTPSPLHPPPVGRPNLPWFPRHSRKPHIIGTKSGALPQKEPGTKAGVRGKTESIEYPLFLLKQGLIVCGDRMMGILGCKEPCSCCHCPTFPQ
uniref:Uncharacterized protein n=1 Tax=Molossus molossus TaxID=27622 RepID=A0A7J8FYN7_MOLMO|nr:hypothetical protein HJG59_008151 [Molossus molossus]